MNKNLIINQVKEYAMKKLSGEGTSHDWWHSLRVWQMTKKIQKKEGGNLFIVELAALLHDISDWKFSGGDERAGAKETKKLLTKLSIDNNTIGHVCYIVENVSFKGAGVKDKMQSIEGKIVQDADRLDVLGAIGIARVFAYGGKVGHEIYNPNIRPKKHKTFKEYKKQIMNTSINHFYEKILLLKARLNTKTAKKIAVRRHKFTENYLKQFFQEWHGKI